MADEVKDWTQTSIYDRLETGEHDQLPGFAEAKHLLKSCMERIQAVLQQGGTAATDFTLHDAQHGFRVAERMVEIIPEDVFLSSTRVRGQALCFAPSWRSLPPWLGHCASNSPAPSITSPPVVIGAKTSLSMTRTRQGLLAVVAQALSCFDAEALAYCLIGNHYHLVLHTRQANLSLLEYDRGRVLSFASWCYEGAANTEMSMGSLFLAQETQEPGSGLA